MKILILTPQHSFFNINDSHFDGSTKILMSCGTCISIRDVCVGDYVLENIDTICINKVTNIIVHKLSGKCYKIQNNHDNNYVLS
jgi:hypothetical protein